MHLDTVFTLIDRNLCLAHLPVIEPGGPESAHVYSVDLYAKELTFTLRPSLLRVLAELGVELDVVPCGGAKEAIDQAARAVDRRRQRLRHRARADPALPAQPQDDGRAGAARLARSCRDEEVVAGKHDLLAGGPAVISLWSQRAVARPRRPALHDDAAREGSL